jgi:hypothetical protein
LSASASFARWSPLLLLVCTFFPATKIIIIHVTSFGLYLCESLCSYFLFWLLKGILQDFERREACSLFNSDNKNLITFSFSYD